MWLHHNGTLTLVKGYKNYKTYKNYPPKKILPDPHLQTPKYELALLMVLMHFQDAPLQNITCRTDCTANHMQREFMVCAMTS